MPALNFKKEFAELVASGKKKQTIRQNRKHPILTGDTLYLYTGMRTKNAKKLATARCISAKAIKIEEDELILDGNTVEDYAVLTQIAHDDGFDTWKDFTEFFKKQYKRLPFYGVLIKWELEDEKSSI